MSQYENAMAKVLEAASYGKDGPGPLSTGEALMAALALNRPDWLARMGYTIVDAMERIGAEWLAFLPRLAREVSEHQVASREAKELADQAMALTRMRSAGDEGREGAIECDARLVTYGSAPGYRDASLTFELQPRNGSQVLRAELRLRPEDGEAIARHLTEVHACAWDRGSPLDVLPGEQRPAWIGARA